MINYLPPEFPQFSDNLKSYYPEETRSVKNITFQVTEDCCMKCTYCYQHNKSNNKMSFEIAKKIIDKLLNNEIPSATTENTFAVVFDFIGGEPLLEIDLLQQICDYTIYKMIELNHPWLYHIRFSICSNGLLYNTPKVQKFFEKYHNFISFSISLDGNKELHDKCRIDLQNNGTYDRVIENIKLYQKQYGDLPGTKMTFSPDNINYVFDALINLINLGYTNIPCNCIFEKGWNYNHAKIYYNELKKIADYLIYNNLYNKINITIFDEKKFCPMDENDNNNWCGGTDMDMIAFDYKGDIYPCIRYMKSSLNNKQKAIKVGNIDIGYLSNSEEKDNLQLISNITRRSQSTDECFYCPIAAGCAWCSGFNYEEFGTPNKRATYICYMHQAESLMNIYYWNTLYKYLNINKQFKIYIPKEWALNIINEQEYNCLLELNTNIRSENICR